MAQKQFQILFVCLGNICRSSVAEGICRHQLSERGLDDLVHCDSCGTGHWHVGEPPHKETVRVAKQNGVSLAGQKARQIDSSDLKKFDLIVAMDRQNKADMESFFDREDEKFICLREFDPDPQDLDVPDPYYGGPDGFVEVFDIVDRSVRKLLDSVEERLSGN